MDYLKKILLESEGPTGAQWESLLAKASSTKTEKDKIESLQKEIENLQKEIENLKESRAPYSKQKRKILNQLKKNPKNNLLQKEIEKLQIKIEPFQKEIDSKQEEVKEKEAMQKGIEGHEKAWNNFKNERTIAEKIINDLKLTDLEKVPNGKVSTIWSKYFENIKKINISGTGEVGSPNGTSKTDLIASSGKYSLKKAGGSQLMSGFKGETLATLFAAFDMLGATDANKLINKFKIHIQKIANGMSGSPADYGSGLENGFKSATEITDLLKSIHDEYLISKGYIPHPKKAWRPKGIKYNDPTVINQIKSQKRWKDLEKEVKKYIQNSWDRRELHKIAKNAFDEIFKNPKIWHNFLYEAATGNIKFGSNTKYAAKKLLEFNPETQKAETKEIKKWVEKHQSEIKLNISFKTAGNNISDSGRLIVGTAPTEEQDESAINDLILGSVLNNIYLEFLGVQKEINKPRVIALDNKSFKNIMDEIYKNYFNSQSANEPVAFTESTAVEERPETVSFVDVDIELDKSPEKISKNIFHIKKSYVEIDAQKNAAEESVGPLQMILQKFIINVCYPQWCNQYTKRVFKILNSKKPFKFFKLIRLFDVSEIKFEKGEQDLYNLIQPKAENNSQDFSFMFREKE